MNSVSAGNPVNLPTSPALPSAAPSSRVSAGALVALLIGAATPVGLIAQDRAPDSEIVEMSKMEVTGFRSSLGDAIEAKRQAGQVSDLITAEEVGQFGDQNIGEAIQRISGVALTRTNGEGESISIRGLSPVFTRIEIDGRSTAVSADSANPGRDSVLSVFASDLYNSIEVVKSPKASDVEGGIGGIVRLNTPDPLTIGRLAWGAEGSITNADLRDSTEPGFSGFYSNVLNEGRLGLLLSATYEERDRRIDKIQSGDPDWAPVSSNDPTLDGGYYPERLRLEQRQGDNPKLNLNGKLQFMATPNLELFLSSVITREERHEDKARIQVEFNRGDFLDGTIDPATNTLIAAEFEGQRVNYNDFRRETQLDTTGISGGAHWHGDLWSARFESGYSEGIEDWYEYTAQARINSDGIGGYDLGDDPRTPTLYTASTTADPSDISLRSLSRDHRIISITETASRLDLKRTLSSRGFTSVELGLRWAETEFTRRQGSQESPISKPNGDDITFADAPSPFVLDGTFGLGKGGEDFLTLWPTVDPKALYESYPSTEPDEFDDNNFYDIIEQNLAAYVMVNFDQTLGENIAARGNLGVRLVQTENTGQGRIRVTTDSDQFLLDDEPALDGDYTEPLPALNLTLGQPGGNLQVRSAITRALSRPTIDELNPSQDINVEDAENSRGNPDLDPFLAWQYDLGLEVYFGPTGEGMFAVSGFYKDVENFIVPTTLTESYAFPDQGIAAQDYLVSTYRNGGAAEISGVEFNLQSPFTFLPGILSRFGGAANYTYTDSEFTDAFGISYSFPGASRDTYNLVLYYEQGGFSGRLAYNYRNDYLIAPANDANGSNALFGEGSGRLDASLRYRFDNGVRLSLDALNLTEDQAYKYYDTPQRYQNFEFEGVIYSFSVAYTF